MVSDGMRTEFTVPMFLCFGRETVGKSKLLATTSRGTIIM